MLDAVQPGKVDYELKEKRLLSDATIRNAEIWMALLELMKQNREYSKDGGSNSSILSYFYLMLSKQKMSTYKVAQDGKPHILSFRFLQPIVQLLKDVEAGTFDRVFDYKGNKNAAAGIVEPLPHIQELFGDYLASYRKAKGKTIADNLKKKFPQLNNIVSLEDLDELKRMESQFSKEELIQFLNEHVMEAESIHEAQHEAQQEAADILSSAVEE